MKRKTFFPPLFLFPLLFTIPTSCKYYAYGLEEFFYRENTLDKRIDTLTELADTQIPQNLPDEYNILVITDIHFGGENKEKNGARNERAFLKLHFYKAAEIRTVEICAQRKHVYILHFNF